MKALRKIRVARMASAIGLCLMLGAVAAFAQSGRETVAGVKNFGRVTDRYFRGGAVSPQGIENLNKMGVRTIIDLRDEPSPDEAPTCERLGIKYYNFPMTGHDAPTEKEISQILSLVQNAKAPVYVHCSAGKHRAGTLAALYRIRVQGWTQDRAWAEQQSYGFGAAAAHPELYAYVYGQNAAEETTARSLFQKSATKSKSKEGDDEEISTSSKARKEEKIAKAKKDDDDDDDKEEKKVAKAKKDDDDDDGEKDDDDDDDDKDKNKSKNKKSKKELKSSKKDKSVAVALEDQSSSLAASNTVAVGLSADARYVDMTEAIERARAAGGKGEVLKIDLEWDELRNLPTWDVTFTSGSEYEVHALNGEVLGNKAKEPAKIATMIPLELNSRKIVSFSTLLRKVATEHRQTVMEVELKHLKGYGETIYEIALTNGVTVFYDAATGEAVNGA